MPTRILITGATGTIGSNAVRFFLSCNYAVRAQVRPGSLQLGKLQGLDAEICAVDLRDSQRLAELVQDMDVVLHLAGMVPKGSPSARDYLDLNVGATLSLLEGVRQHNKGLQRFVFASTTALYEFIGWRSAPITDANRFADYRDMYRVTKRSAELLVTAYHRQHGIPTVILTIPETLCGRELLGERRRNLTPYIEDRIQTLLPLPRCPERDQALAGLAKALESGKRLVLPLGPDGNPWRQHIGDIRDVVRACELASREPRAIGQRMVIKSDALDYGRGIPRLSRLSGLGYVTLPIPGAENYWFDIEKARSLLGYVPQYNSETMLEDAWRHQQGEQIGIIAGADYGRIDRSVEPRAQLEAARAACQVR